MESIGPLMAWAPETPTATSLGTRTNGHWSSPTSGPNDRRVAAILRNSRQTARYFASALPGSSAELHFAHGLYVTLAPKRALDEKQTKQMAADLCGDLRKAGLAFAA